MFKRDGFFFPSLFFNEAVDNSKPVDNFSVLTCFSFVFAHSGSFHESPCNTRRKGAYPPKRIARRRENEMTLDVWSMNQYHPHTDDYLNIDIYCNLRYLVFCQYVHVEISCILSSSIAKHIDIWYNHAQKKDILNIAGVEGFKPRTVCHND